jgi:hypothetical protein
MLVRIVDMGPGRRHIFIGPLSRHLTFPPSHFSHKFGWMLGAAAGHRTWIDGWLQQGSTVGRFVFTSLFCSTVRRYIAVDKQAEASSSRQMLGTIDIRTFIERSAGRETPTEDEYCRGRRMAQPGASDRVPSNFGGQSGQVEELPESRCLYSQSVLARIPVGDRERTSTTSVPLPSATTLADDDSYAYSVASMKTISWPLLSLWPRHINTVMSPLPMNRELEMAEEHWNLMS